MADFGKDRESRFDPQSDRPMSMEDIDRLLSDDELDRMLQDDDVASFIDSQNFQELLNAEDIDGILQAYRKAEPAQKPEPKQEKKLSFSVGVPPEAEQARPAPQPASAQKREQPASASFRPAGASPEPPKYHERFPSFTVEMNRSEIQELAKKQEEQKAALEARTAQEEPAGEAKQPEPEQAAPQPEPRPQPDKPREEKPLYDAVFGIPIPRERQEEAAPAPEPEAAPPAGEEPPSTGTDSGDELDIDALIREIEAEAKAFGFAPMFADQKPAPEPEAAPPAQEEGPETQPEPKESPAEEQPEPEKKPEPEEEPEPEAVKNIRMRGATLEIDVPKADALADAAVELHMPKEAMAIPEPEETPEEEMADELAQAEQQEQEEEKKLPPLTIDPEELPSRQAGGKKHPYALLGVIMTLLALVGAAAVLYFGFGFARDFFTQSETKQEFNHRVYPLVVVDVPAFDSVDRLDSKVVVEAGIWNFLLNEENKEKYEQDDFGTMTVPALDIEVYIYQIFGNDVEIVHQQLSDPDFTVIYDEQNQLYYIPEIPQVLPYAPSVQSVTHTGDDYTVEVGYILPGPFWNVEENAENGEISKTMIYHYTRTEDGDYWISSVENGDIDLDTAVTSSEAGTVSDSLASEATESEPAAESGTESAASSEAA